MTLPPTRQVKLSIIPHKFDPPTPHRHRRRPRPRAIQCDQVPAINNQIREYLHGRESYSATDIRRNLIADARAARYAFIVKKLRAKTSAGLGRRNHFGIMPHGIPPCSRPRRMHC
jgi:hypothetical protein